MPSFVNPATRTGTSKSSEEAALISIDSSLFAAILVFLGLIFALNRFLFKPLLRIQAEREGKTTGLVSQARKGLDHHTELFNRYQDTLKSSRLEGYRRQEELRSEALRKRAEVIENARKTAEQWSQESRDAVRVEVESAKKQLESESREIARGIALTILQRST